MASDPRKRTSLVHSVLLATTALVLLGPGVALARVGVTSATDGDPRGKPPEEAERVLRIGLDVQANELITTGGNDRAHLVFLDGTSLTVGPNAQLTIDKFVYDPNTKTGELAVSATRGVLRLVGGKISKTTPITVTTPSSTIGIRGGITLLNVQPTRTISTFVFGDRMTVSGQGQTQNVTRPGSQVTTAAGAPPSPPSLVAQGGLSGQMAQLEGTSGGGNGGNNGNSNAPGANQPGGAASNAGNSANNGANADQQAQNFGKQGAQQAPSTPPAPPVVGLQGGNPATNPANNPGANAISNTQQQQTEQQAQQQAQQTTTPPVTTTTKVIVSSGRFLYEPVFTQNTGFSPTNLGAITVNSTNDQLLASSATVTTPSTSSNGTLTVATANTNQSLAVPWTPGGLDFTVSEASTPFGPLTGVGFVTSDQSAYAYSFKDQNNQTVGFFGGTLTPSFPTSGYAAYKLYNLNGSTNNLIPFVPDAINNAFPQSAISASPMYSVFAGTLPQLNGASLTQNAGSLQATIAINGLGSSQSSYMGVYLNQFVVDNNDSNTVAVAGNFRGTYRLGATDNIGYVQTQQSTADVGSANSTYGTASSPASTIVLVPDKLANTSTTGTQATYNLTRSSWASIDQTLAASNGALAATNTGYYATTLALQSSTPTGLGATRTDQTLTGFVGGLMDSFSSSGNVTTSSIGSDSSSATISLVTHPSSNSVAATITAPVWGGSSSNTATFVLGNNPSVHDGQLASGGSLFVDDSTYAARDVPNTATAISPTRVAVTSGGSTVTTGGTNITSQTTIVSSSVAPVTTFLQESGVTACTCQYLTWGWWGGSVAYGANSAYNPSGVDRINLATYVAGTPSTTAALDASRLAGATATYNGQLIGNVNNNGSSYVAAGTYSNVWSFGTQTGNVSVAYDGASFNGATALTGGANPAVSVNFATPAPIASTGATGRNLTLNGSFFSSPSSPVAYQAGRFGVTGTNYQAAGTFAAQK